MISSRVLYPLDFSWISLHYYALPYFKVVGTERDGGSNPAARPRGRLDAFEARFFGTLLLVRSQHSGSSLVTWA